MSQQLAERNEQTVKPENGLVVYTDDNGQEIKLSPVIIKKYLVSGDQDKVTDQEVMLFLGLCKYRKLNPFIRDAYLIKFGNSPATMVVGKDVFTRRANTNTNCAGWKAGVIIKTEAGLEEREGTFLLEGELLVGGWAEIHRHNWTIALKHTVSLKECERHKKDGSLMKNWKEMPATMIRKVALVQALREAFPEDLGGMYSQEEMPVDSDSLDSKPVALDGKPTKAERQAKQHLESVKPEEQAEAAKPDEVIQPSEEAPSVQHAEQPIQEEQPAQNSNVIEANTVDEINGLAAKAGNMGKLLMIARQNVGTHIRGKDDLLTINDEELALLKGVVESA